MPRPSKKKAMELIQKALNGIYGFKKLMDDDLYDLEDETEFDTWRRDTEIAIRKIFSNHDGHVDEFLQCFHLADGDEDALRRAKAILRSMLNEVNEHWDDDFSIQKTSSIKRTIQTDTKKVFVIHGRDEGTREMIANFLRQLEIEPVILSEQSNQGLTIIEKFEKHANVGFAVALLTPDDIGALKGTRSKSNPRPRQNVIFELGFFIGKLGRKHVCALTKEKEEVEIEIPADYSGVLYIELDKSSGWKLKLCRELKAAGYDVDANRIVH